MNEELIFKIIICFIAGMGSGIGTGFAGMSAVTVISPLLITFLDIPAYQAITIGLISDVLASGISALTYKKNKNLNIIQSLPLLISVLVMTVVGSYVGNLVPNKAMGAISQISLVILGLKFIIFPNKNEKEKLENEAKKKRIIKSIIGGCIVGFICGFSGAGGGMMLLFVLTTFLGFEMHVAVGTSVFIMAFTALTGGVSHVYLGGVPDILCLILCAVFTFIFAQISARIANKVKSSTLNRVVGIILLACGVCVLVVDYLIPYIK